MLKRDLSLDFVKSVAIALVVLLHTSVGGYVNIGPQWHAALFYRGISIVSVPLFFMVSGAVLIGKDHGLANTARRIIRVLVPLLIWSLIYLTWIKFTEHKSNENWLERIITYPVYTLWFLYTMIVIYLLLPLISWFFASFNTNIKLSLLAVWFIAITAATITNSMDPLYFLGIDLKTLPVYSGYMLLGASIYECMNKNQGMNTLIKSTAMAVIALSLAIGASGYLQLCSGHYVLTYFEFFSPTAVIASSGSFVALQLVYRKISWEGMRFIVNFVSQMTLSIYLMHILLLRAMMKFNFYPSMHLTGAWLWFPLMTLIVLIASILFAKVVRIIPLGKILCPK